MLQRLRSSLRRMVGWRQLGEAGFQARRGGQSSSDGTRGMSLPLPKATATVGDVRSGTWHDVIWPGKPRPTTMPPAVVANDAAGCCAAAGGAHGGAHGGAPLAALWATVPRLLRRTQLGRQFIW